MSKDMQHQLKELQGHRDMCPRSDWVKKNRAALLSEIKKTAPQKDVSGSWFFALQRMSDVFVPKQFAMVSRVLIVGVLSLGMAMGGWLVTVSASSKSLPNEPIRYGVKLATEKTQVMVAAATGNNESEAELHLAFAERRVDELKQISEDKSVYVDKTAERLKDSLESAGKKLKDVQEEEPEKAQNVAKQITEKTTEIAKGLKDIAKDIEQKGDASEVTEAEDAVKGVQEAKKVANDAGIGAIEVLVEGNESPDEEVKTLVEETLEVIISEAHDVKENADEVKEEVEDTAIDPSTTTVAIVGDTPEVSSSTVSTSTPSTSTVHGDSDETEKIAQLTLEETVEKVGESVEKGQEVVEEVKGLLEENNVQEAVEKAKILHAITSETAEVLVEVEKTIQVTRQEIEAKDGADAQQLIDPATSEEEQVKATTEETQG